MRFDCIAFDADDTLWHSENRYQAALNSFEQLMKQYCDPSQASRKAERNAAHDVDFYGFGVKGFILSLIETAIELSEGRITGVEIQQLVNLGKEILMEDVELLEHVQSSISELAARYSLMLITKGDIHHQEAKINKSGLKKFFRQIVVLSKKSSEDYTTILNKHFIIPSRFLMVGNSIRSDILPILEIGGHAVHIPYHITWAYETDNILKSKQKQYYELEHIGRLPALLERLEETVSESSHPLEC